ncbi:hypothetical protein [Flavobacterium sp. LB2P44]|uniref:hypothetical protein n=1 Tax=Flavobacterium sp. LB2P44 TaxID=3401713 RepID=UPI003AAC96C9
MSFSLCFMQSCSTEDIAIEQQSTIETVSKNEAVSFVKNLYDEQRTTAKSSGLQNDFDFDKITQEKVTNTTELLTVIPIKTKAQQQHRRALFLRVGAQIESMIYNEFAEVSSTQNSFDGIILMTRLNGDFIRAYRLKNNKYVVDLVPNKKNQSEQKGIQNTSRTIDAGDLHEVIIINSYKDPSTFVSLNEMGKEVPIAISWNSLGSGGTTGDESWIKNEQELPNPCLDLGNLMNYNLNSSNSLKSGINWLKDKVNATVNNKEAGVEVKKVMNPDETFKYEFTQVLSNDQFSIPMSVGFGYVGGLHSHPSDGHAMFSFQDIRFLLSVYDEASSSRKQEAFNGLVCKDALGNTNTYMLKIENIESLRTQINSVWNDPNYTKFQSEDERIKKIHEDQAKIYAKSNGNLEKSFLEQFKDFGIVLLKADATTDNFDKLTLNNSTITQTPRN